MKGIFRSVLVLSGYKRIVALLFCRLFIRQYFFVLAVFVCVCVNYDIYLFPVYFILPNV